MDSLTNTSTACFKEICGLGEDNILEEMKEHFDDDDLYYQIIIEVILRPDKPITFVGYSRMKNSESFNVIPFGKKRQLYITNMLTVIKSALKTRKCNKFQIIIYEKQSIPKVYIRWDKRVVLKKKLEIQNNRNRVNANVASQPPI